MKTGAVTFPPNSKTILTLKLTFRLLINSRVDEPRAHRIWHHLICGERGARGKRRECYLPVLPLLLLLLFVSMAVVILSSSEATHQKVFSLNPLYFPLH